MEQFLESDFNHTNLTPPMDQDELYASIEILDPSMQLFVVILYSCTALAALGGNGAAIAVLLSKHRSIRLFLVNLALSDVTMAVFSIPFTYTDFVLGRWIFLPEFCPVVQFMQHVSVSVSVYTLTVVSLDREVFLLSGITTRKDVDELATLPGLRFLKLIIEKYLTFYLKYYAIIYPLSGRWTKTRGRLIIFTIWIFSVSISSLQLVHGKAERFEVGGQEFYDCNEIWDEFEGKVYTLLVFFVTFLIPMCVLIYTYGGIGCKMWARRLPGNADASRDRLQIAAKLKVVKMMAIVVALFIICWLPIQIFGLLVHLKPDVFFPLDDEDFPGFVAIFLCCHWLAMANSFVNPIVYCFMSDNFRTDLKQLFSCNKRSVRLDPRTSTFITGSSHSNKSTNMALRPLRPAEESLLRRPIRERSWPPTQQNSKIAVQE